MTSGAWIFISISWIVIIGACVTTLASLVKHSK
jgi:hypothetical protein